MQEPLQLTVFSLEKSLLAGQAEVNAEGFYEALKQNIFVDMERLCSE